MQGHRENSKKVPAPSRVPLRVKSRDLSIPPGLDLHTPAPTTVASSPEGRALHHVSVAPLNGERDGERKGALWVWVAPRVAIYLK